MQGTSGGWSRRPSVGAVCLLAILGLVLAMPSPATAAAKRKPCPSGLVALTFDDGPSPTQTPRLVKILKEKRVHATFFMVGQRVRSAPAVARLVEASGFGIANHTWEHPLLTSISDRGVRKQLTATGRELRRHGLHPGPLMRPPYGGMDARVRRDIVSAGYVPVLWSIDSRDWAGGDAHQIAARILGQLRPHAQNVVLQHDGVNNSPNSIAAVPLVIAEARRRGYCFTSLDDRGRKVYPVPRLKPVALRAGSARTAARPATPARPVTGPGTATADRAATGGVLLSVIPVSGTSGFRFDTVQLLGRVPSLNAALGAPSPGDTAAAGEPGSVALLRGLF